MFVHRKVSQFERESWLRPIFFFSIGLSRQPPHLRCCLPSLGLILRIHSTCSISRGILGNIVKITITLILIVCPTYNGELFP